MRIESIHTRELPAPVEELGRILDTLAGPDDRIWPIERWPNDPIGFDRPLGVGAMGGHGPIRYTVVAYEPGRRIAFEFEAGSGLRGHHRFEVEPVGSDGARMRHVLDVEADGIYRLLRPVFLAIHDALVEDLLDKAELAATGRLARAAQWPRWLRLANRIEVALRPRRGRLAAVAVPGALVALGGIHAAWALGWRWPGGDDAAFAERVVGNGAELPPTWATWAVAAALVAAGAVVHRAAHAAGGRARLAAWGVAAVFTARGLLYIPIDLAGGVEGPYEPLDLAIYSPTALAIGLGTAWLLRNSPAAGTAPAPIGQRAVA
jgi:uncharacterized protein DUF3995/polyketide cyclase/dehydrase/lipid transport protein